nr:hypothetical protein [Tanacetum cinerariifolium]
MRFWSAVFAIYSHGDACLSWGRWGELVGGSGSGGDGLEKREVGCKRVWREKLVGMNSGSYLNVGKMRQ